MGRGPGRRQDAYGRPAGAPASGKGSSAGPWRVAFTPRAKKCLAHAVHEARAEHTGQIGVEHLGLAIVSMTDWRRPAHPVGAGLSGPRLRAEILHRYRQASYDWGAEIRCFLRDPDGHLVELSQAVGG